MTLGVARPARAARVEGYATEMSLKPGGTLELHVRCEATNFAVTIWRQGRDLQRVASVGTFRGINRAVPANAWEGCGWPVDCRVPVPASWRPGAYLARLEAGPDYSYVPFVVRAAIPGSYGPILVQLSTNTWQAYNRYGGKSLYGAHAPGLVGRAFKVSFHRPYNYFDPNGSGQFFLWEAAFIAFLESYDYAYEVCTNTDVHRDPELLEHYRLFCSVGHDEYYTKAMFDALERRVDAGGNLAFFSGNTLWWQCRLEDSEHTLVCYKSAGADPMLNVDPSQVTVNWHASPVFRPPAKLMGVYYNGSSGIPVGAYTVIEPHSWVFRGLHVTPGQEFAAPIVGYEVDARSVDGPPRLDVIAHAELPDHNNNDVLRPCDMVYYERTPEYGYSTSHGGAVFACGSVNFAMGLVNYYNGWVKVTGTANPIARGLAVNVLDRLGGWIAAPELVIPSGPQSIVNHRIHLQWHPPRATRPGMPIHYDVFVAATTSSVDTLHTDSLSIWAPVPSDKGRYWWVRAHTDWGETATSPMRLLRLLAAAPVQQPHSGLAVNVQLEARKLAIQIMTPTSSSASIEVFDIAGRRVGRLQPGVLPAGVTTLDWDLADSDGKRISRGIYFVDVQVGKSMFRRRIMVLH